MDAERWRRVTGVPEEVDEHVQLYWATFHTDDTPDNPDREELLRLARDPVEALGALDLGTGGSIGDEWKIHTTFANHDFGVFWQPCLAVLMVSPTEKSVAMHVWKVRPVGPGPGG